MNLTLTLVAAAAGLGAAALAAAPAADPAADKPGKEKPMPARTGFLFETLRSNGIDYKYVVYVPREYDPGKAWPTIVFLHGAGESGTDGLKPVIQGLGSAIMWSPERWPFLVVIPQKPDIRHQWEQHDEAVMAMLARARKDYNVDGKRIYLTGLSQGGYGTWVLGARHADTWAAIAPICGYAGGFSRREPDIPANLPKPFTGTLADIGRPLKDMPVWAFHGEADNVVPVKETKDLVAAVKEAGGDPKMTLFPDIDHNSWDKAYREMDLYAWFLAHRKR